MSINVDTYRHGISEHQLQARVLQQLKIKGRPDILAFAIPNAARRSLGLGARMKAEGLIAGVADLCILLPAGQTAWLELKSRRGHLTIPQKGFKARCERLGHRYCVAKSFEQAMMFLADCGALK